VNEATSVIVDVIFGAATQILNYDNLFKDFVRNYTQVTLAHRWVETVSDGPKIDAGDASLLMGSIN
jgi:hypothetical protein